MHNVYLFQPNYQIGLAPFISQWLPYSIAAVWAYVEQFEEIKRNFVVKECIFKREELETILNRLDNPSLCFFSNYIWNENYNLLLAKIIKENYPNCKIIFGGPQVHDDGLSFLVQNSNVDSVVIGEGEESCLRLLLDFLKTKRIQKIYDKEKRVDLDNVASPYIDSNIMTNIVIKNPNIQWAATLETNRGCPFACTFCDWGSLTQSKINKFPIEKVYAEIDWIVQNKIEYLYIADANFGIFYERDRQIIEYLCSAKQATGYPHTVNITWNKNSTEKTIELVLMLEKVGLNRGMTLSVQSMSDLVLKSIKRKNMEINKLEHMYKQCNDNNIKFYTEFILGLPEETKTTWEESLAYAVQIGCHNGIEIYPLEILRNSQLSHQIKQHNMEILNFQTIEPDQITKIPENHNFVISTAYMTRQDFIDCWMWGWMMVNFHTYGWTQIYSRVAFKFANVSTFDFYKNFYLNCLRKNTLLFDLYDRQEQDLKKFFWDLKIEEADLFQNDDVPTYKYQMVLHNNRVAVQQIINDWSKDFLGDKIPHDLFEGITRYSDNFTVNFNEKDPKTIEFFYNIPEYCLTSAELKNQFSRYVVYNSMDWEDYQDFATKINFKHRFGFSRRDYRKIL